MLLIVQETHPTLLQDVTVKNVAINQDSSVKYTNRGGWGRWKNCAPHRSCWNLSMKKYLPVKERVVGSYLASTETILKIKLSIWFYIVYLLLRGTKNTVREINFLDNFIRGWLWPLLGLGYENIQYIWPTSKFCQNCITLLWQTYILLL